MRAPLERAGAVVVVIAPHGGTIASPDGPVEVTKSALTTQSVEYDALIVAGGTSAKTLGQDPYLAVNLGEAYRHYKTIAAWGAGQDILAACSIPGDAPGIGRSRIIGRRAAKFEAREAAIGPVFIVQAGSFAGPSASSRSRNLCAAPWTPVAPHPSRDFLAEGGRRVPRLFG